MIPPLHASIAPTAETPAITPLTSLVFADLVAALTAFSPAVLQDEESTEPPGEVPAVMTVPPPPMFTPAAAPIRGDLAIAEETIEETAARSAPAATPATHSAVPTASSASTIPEASTGGAAAGVFAPTSSAPAGDTDADQVDDEAAPPGEQSPAEPATVGPATVGPATVGPATVEAATVEPASVDVAETAPMNVTSPHVPMADSVAPRPITTPPMAGTRPEEEPRMGDGALREPALRPDTPSAEATSGSVLAPSSPTHHEHLATIHAGAEADAVDPTTSKPHPAPEANTNQPIPPTAARMEMSPPMDQSTATRAVGLARRIEDTVRMLENAPPPRTVTLDLEELDGLRLTVALRPDGVHISSPNAPARLVEGIERALLARGFDLSGGTGDGRQREHESRPDPWQPDRHRPTGRTRPGLRL